MIGIKVTLGDHSTSEQKPVSRANLWLAERLAGQGSRIVASPSRSLRVPCRLDRYIARESHLEVNVSNLVPNGVFGYLLWLGALRCAYTNLELLAVSYTVPRPVRCT